jgi:hypothetical protein
MSTLYPIHFYQPFPDIETRPLPGMHLEEEIAFISFCNIGE